MSLKVGIIGCGRPGQGQARSHMRGYTRADVELVALADLSLENAEAFQQEFGAEAVYADYREMLASHKFDVVSICTWPHLHAPMVIAAAEAGVRAIHCEKPMATSWGAAKRMVAACESRGVQLTFNHQRRFGEPFQKAKELLKSGAIGQLVRLEGSTDNLFDWGTHWFDMFFFYNDENPATWVLGQIEWRGSRSIFGAPIERFGLSHIRFANGVHGIMSTGPKAEQHEFGAANRLVGTDGVIEVGALGESIPLRIMNNTSSGWLEIPTEENLHSSDAVAKGIANLIESLRRGTEPELSARRALRATEIIFATYESSRRRGRVELPLFEDESGLISILSENDAIPPGVQAHSTHS